MAAAGARGETVLTGAAREPEIEILCGFLRAMGVRVEGEGTSVIKIRGTSTFEDTSFFIPGDRIVAGTYLGAVLCAGGRVFLEQAPADHMERTIETPGRWGHGGKFRRGNPGIHARRPHPIRLETGPYPEFPTDMQSVMMAAASIADGTSRIQENVFENRFARQKNCRNLGHIL